MSFSLAAFCRVGHIQNSRSFATTTCLLARKSRTKVVKKGGWYDSEKLKLAEALEVLRCHEVTHPNSTFELTINTAMPRGVGIPRGRISMPHHVPTRATRQDTVLVFTDAENIAKAKQSGADIVGGMELIEPVASGKVNASIILCTPSFIRTITPRLGRILGPRGLMPSERRGTVTDKIKEYIDTLKGSKEWRGDKHGTIRLPVGKITYPAKHVTDNVKALVQSVRVATNTNVPDGVAAPDPNKPRNPITKIVLSSSTGPGIRVSDLL